MIEDVKRQEIIKIYHEKFFVPALLFSPLVTLAQTFIPQILRFAYSGTFSADASCLWFFQPEFH